MMGLASCVFLYDRAETTRGRQLAGLAALLNLMGIFLSGSRGSLIGAWVGIMLYLCLARRPAFTIAAVVVTYIAVLILAAGVVQLPASNPINRLVNQTGDTSGANQQREEALRRTLDTIDDSPVFGAGYDGIVAIHIVYLQGWVGSGAVGGLTLMLLGATMLVLPVTQPRQSLALACGAAAVAVAWIFTNILTTRTSGSSWPLPSGSPRRRSRARSDSAELRLSARLRGRHLGTAARDPAVSSTTSRPVRRVAVHVRVPTVADLGLVQHHADH